MANKKVFALVSELMFKAKIKEVTSALDSDLSTFREPRLLVSELGAAKPDLIVLDLAIFKASDAQSLELAELVASIKQHGLIDATWSYTSHVDSLAIEQAQNLGLVVWPRSKAISKLQESLAA